MIKEVSILGRGVPVSDMKEKRAQRILLSSLYIVKAYSEAYATPSERAVQAAA